MLLALLHHHNQQGSLSCSNRHISPGCLTRGSSCRSSPWTGLWPWDFSSPVTPLIELLVDDEQLRDLDISLNLLISLILPSSTIASFDASVSRTGHHRQRDLDQGHVTSSTPCRLAVSIWMTSCCPAWALIFSCSGSRQSQSRWPAVSSSSCYWSCWWSSLDEAHLDEAVLMKHILTLRSS